MKRISIFIFIVTALFTVACKDYLDINTNPNAPTSVTANLILPQALAATALVLNRYNTYGAQIGGYSANAGGYGGFNELVSYAYTSNNYNDLWPNTYDNLEDYQYIIDKTTGDAANIYFNAVATIMRANNFQLLVDAFNDVPYSQALHGDNFLTPAYDQGPAIYASLAAELDAAIASINAGQGMATKNAIDNYDIVFRGNMNKWKQLANTIKLRLLLRGQGKVTFANSSFDAVGFLTTDALINPGYARDNNRQNPKWNTWAWTYTGTAGNKAWIPTSWIVSFYDGTNLNDPGRGNALYYQFGGTISNQLGVETVNAPKCPEGSFWFPSNVRVGVSAGNATGVLKGPEAGFPLLTAAESYFLQAEAMVAGIAIPGGGSAASHFDNGITASFQYLYQLPDNTYAGDYTADAATYIADNNASYLLNFSLAA